MTINLTDPASHPANSALAAERIERVIEALESSLAYRNGSTLDHFIADAVKGLRELRVSREAVPVAWMYDGEDGREYNGHNEFSGGGKGMPLYAAPPAPATPDGWKVEAERLAKLHGCSFVVFRHGEEPQCADPTKVIISFTDKGLGYADAVRAPATHDCQCRTCSNEPRQIGSAYPAAPKEVGSALEMGMARYSGAMQKLADGGD